MFSFLRRFSSKQHFIVLNNYNGNSFFISRSYLKTVDTIYQSEVGTDKQRTHICKGDGIYVVRETPEEIFRLLNQ